MAQPSTFYYGRRHEPNPYGTYSSEYQPWQLPNQRDPRQYMTSKERSKFDSDLEKCESGYQRRKAKEEAELERSLQQCQKMRADKEDEEERKYQKYLAAEEKRRAKEERQLDKQLARREKQYSSGKVDSGGACCGC